MAKATGIGAAMFLDEYDITNDVGSVESISKSITTLDLTGIDKGAPERRAAMRSAAINCSAFHNTSNTHTAIRAMASGADRIVSYFHRSALGTPVASMTSKHVGNAWTRGTDGGFTASVESSSNAYWLDWGYSLTAGKVTHTAATNVTGVDFGASYSFGLQAYLHVISFTGTSATITIQSSSDNGVGDAFSAITSGAFTTVTGATKERIATASNQAIERYLRIATTGTFSSLVFAVQATVNQTDMSGL